jgi:transcriptional regulator with XRE-family HTH domain
MRRRNQASLVRWIEVQKRRIGGCVRAHREARGLTRVVAAEAIGIHHIHLAKIELGRANITLATLVSIANAFELELRSFFHAPPHECGS